MSILGPGVDFWGSVARFINRRLGSYVKIMDAKVVAVSGTSPNQKAIVARPDELAAIESGELDEIPRIPYPVYGTVVVDQQVWCIAWSAGLRIMGTPSSSGGGGGGVTAHGALTGLSNDDHQQYFNQSRGDDRYRKKTDQVAWDTEISGKPNTFLPDPHLHPEYGRGFTPRGAWSATTAYAVDDLVQYEGSTYRCITAGTNAQTPSNAPIRWELWAQKGIDGINGRGFTPRGAWSPSTVYAVDDLVQYAGETFRNQILGANSTPPEDTSTKWEKWVQKGDKGIKGDDGDASGWIGYDENGRFYFNVELSPPGLFYRDPERENRPFFRLARGG